MARKILLLASLAMFCLGLSVPCGAVTKRVYWIMRIDWNSDLPEAAETLKVHPDKPADWDIEYGEILIDDFVPRQQPPQDYDLLVMTGHQYYAFTGTERAKLEAFIRRGGTLWIDDCGAIELDNLPLEITFGHAAWGSCTGTQFTVREPAHPLLHALFDLSDPALIRTDTTNYWFAGFTGWDPAYHVLIEGDDQSASNLDGPALIAGDLGCGHIAATAMDVSCALEAWSYGTFPAPAFDFHLVFNLMKWAELGNPSCEAGVDVSVCEAQPVRVTAAASTYSACSGAVEYQWWNDLGRIVRPWSTDPEHRFIRTLPGTYVYTVAMRCSAFPDCVYEDQVAVQINDCSTAVRFLTYGARAQGETVRVTWTTATETDTLGFTVESEREDGSGIDIVAPLVPAHGPVAPYEIADPGAGARYRIVEITTTGARGDSTPFFDPDAATIGRTRSRRD